nr:MAG TPA: Glutaredoxin [Inoviridae sp.]
MLDAYYNTVRRRSCRQANINCVIHKKASRTGQSDGCPFCT